MPGLGDTTWGFNVNGTACDEYFNISEDPLFASTENEDYYLSQLASGQAVQSPCVDAGADTTSYYNLFGYSTRTDDIYDRFETDMGFHRPGIIDNTGIDEFVPSMNENKLTNYPNPFNPSTTFSFNLPNYVAEASLEIFNIKGQKVKSFVCHQSVAEHDPEPDEGRSVRTQNVTWDGRDRQNNPVASGIYLAILKADSKTLATKKMMLLK